MNDKDSVGLRFEAVTKVLGQVKAVDHLSLEIRPGELFFLLGPSGCGKTTALRLIAGFYTPDEGRILFNGHDQSRVPPHKRNTGMVFQNYALWPHMDVQSNVAYGLRMRRLPEHEQKQRVARALEIVQMQDYATRSPNQLSGGQQQRVALARALVVEPDVVLLDEPLSNLDAKLRVEMRAQIKEIHRKIGRTMIYVTHDQAEALSMADRIAVLRQGRVVQVGTPRELYRRPRSAFVAGFIGGSNLLRGTLEATGELWTVRTSAGLLRATGGAEGVATGDAVVCSIRPECVRWEARAGSYASSPECTNRLSARVQSIMYLGNTEEYSFSLPGGGSLRAVEYNPAETRAAVGAEATLEFDPRDVIVLPQEHDGEPVATL
ncbi:MAG TPA: ABC transporter ATP-binding protein [candidate division Zixibacteria bacterium]|nr:ABC transporter ATP-binding protein [candidate division Zixibacteria bacterium]